MRPPASRTFRAEKDCERRDRSWLTLRSVRLGAVDRHGQQKWQNSSPLRWEQEVTRFFTALKKSDDFLGSSEPVQAPLEKLFQGPIADALTHVGQIAILRRMADAPVKGESYFVADIQTGRVGDDQSPPKREF